MLIVESISGSRSGGFRAHRSTTTTIRISQSFNISSSIVIQDTTRQSFTPQF